MSAGLFFCLARTGTMIAGRAGGIFVSHNPTRLPHLYPRSLICGFLTSWSARTSTQFLEKIETLLRTRANSQGHICEHNDDVQDMKELWEIVANRYREEFGEDPPRPFWTASS